MERVSDHIAALEYILNLSAFLCWYMPHFLSKLLIADSVSEFQVFLFWHGSFGSFTAIRFDKTFIHIIIFIR